MDPNYERSHAIPDDMVDGSDNNNMLSTFHYNHQMYGIDGSSPRSTSSTNSYLHGDALLPDHLLADYEIFEQGAETTCQVIAAVLKSEEMVVNSRLNSIEEKLRITNRGIHHDNEVCENKVQVVAMTGSSAKRVRTEESDEQGQDGAKKCKKQSNANVLHNDLEASTTSYDSNDEDKDIDGILLDREQTSLSNQIERMRRIAYLLQNLKKSQNSFLREMEECYKDHYEIS